MPRPLVTVTRRLPPAVEARLVAGYNVRLNSTDAPLDQDKLARALSDSDALVSTLGDPLGAATLNASSPRAKIIAHFGVGYDNIDVGTARALGIAVTNTPGVLTDDTADLAILLMLAAARRASEGERELRAGEWPGWSPTHLLGSRMSGKTLGVIGFGRIGQAVARRARDGFGMNVLAWSRSLTERVAAGAGVTRCATVEELIRAADFISLHVPSTPDTHNLMSAPRIALMKPGAILVNTARGDIVDEAALIKALNTGAIRGAGLDVFDGEPRVNPGLLDARNVAMLPHIGSATHETRTAMGMLAVDNLDAFFAGRELPNRVA